MACGILATPCGRGDLSAEGVPSSRKPRLDFIQPALRVKHSRNREAAWRRLRPCEFGPTDANKVLFSPEDTHRQYARCVRRLRRDECNRQAASLVRRWTGNTMPQRRVTTFGGRCEEDVARTLDVIASTGLEDGFLEAWLGRPTDAHKTTSDATNESEVGDAVGAPSARLSLERLRPRRASFRFTRRFKRSIESTIAPKQTRNTR